ncbi:hypothetical protein [Antarcticibacterium sp. 1MA-6-2]|uniref:hypothetical protein n=1 Tax=Antarcticibacterium sp. 1MA-6-2 TaxID=2908210 RepID=UPI0021083D9C|nr:hypothetical protein [Antarcticibacterium sp. 1MA-6-2]
MSYRDSPITVVTRNTNVGVLYGTFRFIKEMQLQNSITALNIRDSPKIQLRVLNHWDNLDRTVERGYA